MYKKIIDIGYTILMVWGGFAPLLFLVICMAIWGWKEILTENFRMLGIGLIVALPATIAIWWINRNSQDENYDVQTTHRVVLGLIIIGTLNAFLAGGISFVITQLSLLVHSFSLWVFIFFAVYFGGSALIAFGLITVLEFLLRLANNHRKML